MYLTWLADARLYEVLARIDADLAATTRQAGCRVCGAAVHSARSDERGPGASRGRLVSCSAPAGSACPESRVSKRLRRG